MLYSHDLTPMGRAEEGTEQMRLALELDPLNPFVQSMYGNQLGMIDDFQGCIRVLEDVMATTPGFGFGHGALMVSYHELGERNKAIGHLYEYADEAEKALDWYELGYQITGPCVTYLGVGTKSPKVRSNPRFIKLLRDIKLDYWADKYSQSGK